MKISELLDGLPEPKRSRFLGRIEGLQLGQRVCRNRSQDVLGIDGAPLDESAHVRANEAALIAEMIRLVQVPIGSGLMAFGDLTPDELDAIWRIS